MRKSLRLKKKMKFLLDLSVTAGKLDPQKIAFIAKVLSRRELGVYLSLLQKKRAGEKVEIITALAVPRSFAKSIVRLFSGKEVTFVKNPHILAGMQVLFADYVFDASFQHYLEGIRTHYEVN